MKKLLIIILTAGIFQPARAQEAFTITHYYIDLKINKNASVDVTEKIEVHFSEPRHGIIRSIQFQYPIEPLPAGIEKAQRQMQAKGYAHIIFENIRVPGHRFTISKKGDFENIKIGSSDKYVQGNQEYVIRYRLLNVINFFSNHSELYFNLIGNQWATTIDSADFKVELPAALPDTPYYFVATGPLGSKEKNVVATWTSNKVMSGHIIKPLKEFEGLTVGVGLPGGFLTKPDYTFRGTGWLLLPVIVFIAMYFAWKKWGRDEKITVQTEYYPPENISPGVSGYIIDDKLNRRDLTALIPYWGAGGFLKVNEIEKVSLLGMIHSRDYEFIKLKELPDQTLQFEKTLFAGIFKTGDQVKLSSLKNVLYSTMNLAKSQLEGEISQDDYYVKYSRGFGCFFPFTGILATVIGILILVDDWQEKLWLGSALVACGIILISFGVFMPRKTKKGTAVYRKLLGFREFIKTVEKDRLEEFLRQDENYFDKVLPYAIVFGIAAEWKDKLKGLEVPPPKWYSANYGGGTFNTIRFMNSLDHSMNEMANTFYSSPHSTGSSGGSFSGGGGFSGGGFGGGGGSSW